jgi:hypothetical protein
MPVYAVSQYLLDKYYERYVEEMGKKNGRMPTALESRNWLNQFIVKQILIADSISRGFGCRIEITQEVDRMERNVLSSATGPLYRSLYQADQNYKDIDAQAVVFGLEHQIKGMIVRFRSSSLAAEALGADFATCSSKERVDRLEQLPQTPGIESLSGALKWPYSPFEAIAALIPRARVDKLECFSLPKGVMCYMYIKEISTQTSPKAIRSAASLTGYAEMFRQSLIRRSRRDDVLYAARVEFDNEILQRMSEALVLLQSTDETVPEAPSILSSTEILGRYRLASGTMNVTCNDFRCYLNNLFLRKIPKGTQQIRDSIGDMIVQEVDVRDARRLGLDKTPEFVGDRDGYAGLECLDLFEKEILEPEINLSSKDLEFYYAAHQSEFREVRSVLLTSLEFPSNITAEMWLDLRALSSAGTGYPQTRKQVELVKGQSIAGFENFSRMFFSCRDGQAIGPVSVDGKTFVFIKEKDTSIGLTPYSSQAGKIHAILRRQRMDELEFSLAMSDLLKFKIRNNIDYSHFGENAAIVAAGTLL